VHFELVAASNAAPRPGCPGGKSTDADDRNGDAVLPEEATVAVAGGSSNGWPAKAAETMATELSMFLPSVGSASSALPDGSATIDSSPLLANPPTAGMLAVAVTNFSTEEPTPTFSLSGPEAALVVAGAPAVAAVVDVEFFFFRLLLDLARLELW
jgi:hypothetical protein